MLPGETLLSGAEDKCPDCQVRLTIKVCKSGAGFYLGSWCNCGPYSRESGYFCTEAEAKVALAEYRCTGDMPNQRY